jgi:hypothetical protein
MIPKNRVQQLRLRNALAIRKIQQKGLQSKSSSVRRQWQRLVPLTDRLVKHVRPPRKFFPFEKFVSLQELENFDSNGDAKYAFRQVRKGKFWDSNAGFRVSLLGAAMPLFLFGGGVKLMMYLGVPTVGNKGAAILGGFGIGSLAAGVTISYLTGKFGKKRVAEIKEGMGALKTFLERNPHPKLRELVDSKKFNLVVADLENDGFRFVKIVPKDLDLMIHLGSKPNGGVVVFDKNGKLVRGIPQQGGKFILPEAERRSGNEQRTGAERRIGERRTKIVGQLSSERRKFQERRKAERRTGKERRAPPEERTENQF